MNVEISSEKCTKEYAQKQLRMRWKEAKKDPARPKYHFCPMSGWMNDPNGGIYVNGAYHVFYLQDPFHPDGISGTVMEDGTVINGEEKPNRFWGHTRTFDFKSWEYLPFALIPDRKKQEIKPISGSVIRRRDGSYFTAFTSVRYNQNRYSQWGAFSTDELINWERTEQELLAPPEGLEIEGDWRDPYLFCIDGRYYIAVGAGTESEALLLLYEENRDFEGKENSLEKWNYKGILLSKSRKEIPFFECPKVLVLGEWIVILFSPYRQVEYYSGKFSDEQGKFQIFHQGYIDWGKTAYATVDIEKKNGEMYFLSWAPGWFAEKKLSFQAWNGCMTLPRKVSIDNAGHLYQEPASQIKDMRKEEVLLKKGREQWTSAQGIPPQFEFWGAFDEGIENNLEIIFQDFATGEFIQKVTCAAKRVEINETEILLSKKVTEIDCYCDGFLWEFFINRGEAVLTLGTEKTAEIVSVSVKSQNNLRTDNPSFQCCLWKIMDANYKDCMV